MNSSVPQYYVKWPKGIVWMHSYSNFMKQVLGENWF
jgi:hypothetical protein